jgi:membrane-associated protease RseP (regulator of RpoE activity)
VKDPLGDDAPPVETRKAVVGISLMLLAIVALVIVRPSTAVTVAIIVGLILTIMLHEFGHYVAAKRSGMKVTEFFLGFGPRLWSFRRGETEYGIKAIPAGGYVRIIGMTNLEEVDPEDEARTYRQATTGKRLITVLAGIIVNLIIALVLVFGILVLHGPENSSTTIDLVSKGSPAAAAGLRSGDRIVAIDGTHIKDWDQVGTAIKPNRGKPLTFTVERDGQNVDVTATPKLIDGAPRVGITSALVGSPMNPLAAAPRSFTVMRDGVSDTVGALGKVFSASGLERYGKTVTNSKGGFNDQERPRSVVGIVASGNDITGGDWWVLLALLASINVFVALFNLLPLPPLDGGHAAVAIYEGVASKIRGRRVRVDYQKLMPVAAAVVVVILVFGLSTIYLDLRSL